MFEQNAKLLVATASKSSAPACSSSVSLPKAAGTCKEFCADICQNSDFTAALCA